MSLMFQSVKDKYPPASFVDIREMINNRNQKKINKKLRRAELRRQSHSVTTVMCSYFSLSFKNGKEPIE